MKLNFIPVKTRIVRPPKDDITDIIDSLDVKDGDIIFITSKILGLHEGRTVKTSETSKEDLIRSEAEASFAYVNSANGFPINLTITQNILIPAAGIDESNADGYYCLWPKDPDASCR